MFKSKEVHKLVRRAYYICRMQWFGKGEEIMKKIPMHRESP
jgi:hypothetical protein